MQDIEIQKVNITMLDGIAELEKLCFCCPWSKKSLELLCGDSAVGFAALDKEGRVLAYCGMLTVLDEGQITNVACHPDARRNGLGKAVVGAILEYGKNNGIVTFSLEVRESNVAAISLYEKMEFVKSGLRKDFYTSPKENAIVMIKNI